MNKKQKILAIFTLGLILFLLAGNAGKIYAQQSSSTILASSGGMLINGFTVGAINFVLQGIGNIIGFIGGILFKIAGGLTNLALSLNFDILNNPMITAGWQITRDLANLGFVLFIIIIAIATILRMQQYGAKNALGKLIAVALLVNFSLVFAGIFIDFSNMLTNFFIKSIAPEDTGIGGLGPSLANAFGIQSLLKVKDETGMSSLLALEGQYSVIASSLFVAAFTFFGALSLLALAAMFLVRYIALSILLILVPLAFLFTILPATGKLFNQWQGEFMRWIVFAPTASFFLYLAVYMTTNYGKMMDALVVSSQGIGTTNQMNFANLVIDQPLQTIGRMVIVIGILLGGLIAANSMGITGAKTFLGVAQAVGKQVRGRIGRGFAGMATLPLRTDRGQKFVEGMQKTRGFRRLGTMLSGVGVEQGSRMTKQAEERISKRFASDRSAVLALPTLNWEERLAVVKRLIKNKTTNLMTEKDINALIGNKAMEINFKRLGAGNVYEDFEKATGRNRAMIEAETPEARAQAAKEFHETFSPKDYDNLRTKTFTADEEFVDANLVGILHNNPGALSKLMSKFNAKDFDEFNKRFKRVFDKEIDKSIKGIDQNIDIGGVIGLEAEKKLDWLQAKNKDLYNKYKTVLNAQTKNLARRAMGFEEVPPTQT